MIRFSNKFREDLELIYAKYTNPFDGAPELTLSTCELPENIQLIENYSKCGKWTVLEGSSRDMYADDSSDESNVDTSDEEGQSSCYDSDEQNSSNCSPSFETLFRDKYPRSCVKRASESPSMDWTSTQSTCRKSTISNNVLAKPCAYDIDEQCKPQETVTLPKDLWSQVQQCLHLMTSVFSRLKTECGEENDGNGSPSQRRQSLVEKSCVKQRLFDDCKVSDFPKGQSVEKLFVRQKGSKGPGIELASRKRFLHDSGCTIAEIENFDSGFSQENSSDDFISASCKTTVSETSNGSCCESLYRKRGFVKESTADYCPKSTRGDLSCSQISHQNHNKVTQGLSVKKHRRYRLVRRRSNKAKSTSNDTKENELNVLKRHDAVRNEHSFDQCLSDTEDFHISKSGKKKIVECKQQSEFSSSPEMHEVILVSAPSTPVIQKSLDCPQEMSKNTTPPPQYRRSSTPRRVPGSQTSLYTELNIKERCSSTPRKHIQINGRGKKLLNHNECLKQLEFPTPCSLPADSMPSPIRSTANNKHLNGTSSSPKSECTKDSLVKSISTQSPSSILIPEISVNFLGPKEIVERSSLVKDNTNKHKIAFTRNKDITGAPPRPPCHIPIDRSKQKHLSHIPCNDEDGNLFLKGTASLYPTSTPGVEPSKRREQCYRDDARVKFNSEIRTSGKTTANFKRSMTTIDGPKFDGCPSDSYQQLPRLKITPRRRTFHPYATANKFPKTPSPTVRSSLISPLRDLTIKTPSSSSYKWTTLDRSPMAICVKEARRMSDPVVASRKILKFGSHDAQSDRFNPDREEKVTRHDFQSYPRCSESSSQKRPRKLLLRKGIMTDSSCEGDDSRSNCLNGKCTKTFCFNCSMELS